MHPRNFDLRLLGYFFRTAQTGNITRAADVLRVSQPALTKSMQKLDWHAEVDGASRFECQS